MLLLPRADRLLTPSANSLTTDVSRPQPWWTGRAHRYVHTHGRM